MYHSFHKNMKNISFQKWILSLKMRNISWANQHLKIISEGSRDTEDWTNYCWEFSIAITGINCILK